MGGQRHAPAALPPGKTRYPSYGRPGGPQSRSRQVRKISPLPGFDPRTVQPVAIPALLGDLRQVTWYNTRKSPLFMTKHFPQKYQCYTCSWQYTCVRQFMCNLVHYCMFRPSVVAIFIEYIWRCDMYSPRMAKQWPKHVGVTATIERAPEICK